MTAKNYKFEHKGKTYSIPNFNELPMGALRKARKANDEADQAFTIIEVVMGEDSAELAALDSMTAKEFQAFLEGWTQGAPLGESSSSAS
jgi:hypothetical protein